MGKFKLQGKYLLLNLNNAKRRIETYFAGQLFGLSFSFPPPSFACSFVAYGETGRSRGEEEHEIKKETETKSLPRDLGVWEREGRKAPNCTYTYVRVTVCLSYLDCMSVSGFPGREHKALFDKTAILFFIEFLIGLDEAARS